MNLLIKKFAFNTKFFYFFIFVLFSNILFNPPLDASGNQKFFEIDSNKLQHKNRILYTFSPHNHLKSIILDKYIKQNLILQLLKTVNNDHKKSPLIPICFSINSPSNFITFDSNINNQNYKQFNNQFQNFKNKFHFNSKNRNFELLKHSCCKLSKNIQSNQNIDTHKLFNQFISKNHNYLPYSVDLNPSLTKCYVLPSEGIKFENILRSKSHISIVHSRWNSEITKALSDSVVERLKNLNSTVLQNISVPGAFELPIMAKTLANSEKCEAVIAIGCLIKGETFHFDFIADSVSHGLMKTQLEIGKPIIFGVLTCNNLEEAMKRSIGPEAHGPSWADSAVEMIHKLRTIKNK